MTLLEFFFLISWSIILILSIDISRKQKFNALHFIVFLWIWIWLLTFSFFPNVLNSIWNIFWVARWADVLVYTSIIFLLYFVLLLLNKHIENKENITELVRSIWIENSNHKIIKWNEVFLIRVYNEAEVIKWVLDEIVDSWYDNILVINDWSTDDSRLLLESYWNEIVLINHLKNRWWWAALKTWLEYLKKYWKTNLIITFDADWQHSLKNLELFFDEFKNNKNLDIVLWSRFIKHTNTNVPFIRKQILFLWKLFTFFMSKIYLTDSHNWYRVFKSSILNKIDVSMDWMEYASELIESIWKNKLNFKEVPVDIKYTEYSLNKWQSNWNAINIAIRFIWKKFFK